MDTLNTTKKDEIKRRRAGGWGAKGIAAMALLAVPLASGGWAQSQSGGVRVNVDGAPVLFAGQQPVEQGGRVLVPLRGVLEKIGAFVRYDTQTKTVIALRGATRITLPVGGRQALVGDKPVSLDVPARIVNGSTLVPLRFVAESLGAQVSFDVGSRSVAISTGTAVPATGTTTPTAGTGGASSAVVTSANEEIVTGTVTAVYPNLAPRRLVVRRDRGAQVGEEKTIPLRSDALVSVRRPNGRNLATDLNKVRIGDTVRVRQSGDGAALAVEVTQRATNTGTAAATPTRPNAPVTAFRGEFLESRKLSDNVYQFKMTDGRTVEVNGNAVLLYGAQKVTFEDLRSGDAVTVALDPRTGRGTRVVIAADR